MSAIVHAIDHAASAVINSVVDALYVGWKEVLLPILRDIGGLFGIADKDVIHTSINSQRVITSDTVVGDTMVKLALRHQKDPDNSVISKLAKMTSGSRGKYNSYYEKGKNGYIDGLPDTRIKTIYADEAKIKAVIDSVYSINCVIDYADIHVPTKYEHVKFVLQENLSYQYKAWNNTLTYNGAYGVQTYVLDTVNYNYTNNNYDLSVSAHETQTTQNSTVTVSTITSINAANDNRNTKTYSRVLLTGEISGVISDVSTLLTEINTTIPANSEVSATVEVVDSTTYGYDVMYDTQALVISSYIPNLDYVVKYYTTSNTEWKYWVYDESTGVYPTLTYEFSVLTNLDMLPVITVRNNFVNSNVDKTSVRYKDSKDMMKVLGLNLDTFTDEISKNPDVDKVADVFVHFGLSFNETNTLASKLFFDMFSTVQPDNTSGKKYSITFSEGPMNMAIAWTDMTSIVHNGVLGELGYAEHDISIIDTVATFNNAASTEAVVKIRKQTGPEQYTEVIMHNMSNVTFIDRQGLWGTVNIQVNSSDFFIPISQYHVSKYSGLEQMEIMAMSLRTTQYAAILQHVKWYQTGAFSIFLQILGVIIIIVGCIYSACSVAGLGVELIIYAATTLALKWVFAHTHNPWLRGLAVVVAIIVGAEGSAFAQTGSMLSATQLVNSVTTFSATNVALGVTTAASFVDIYTADQMYKLEGRKTAFDSALQHRVKSLREKQRALYAGAKVTVKDMAAMATKVDPIQYMKTTSVDYMMYVARDIQYDFGILYDYDIIVKDFYNQKLSLR